MTEENIKEIRMYLMDSLMSRNGLIINPETINEVVSELVGRLEDMNDE